MSTGTSAAEPTASSRKYWATAGLLYISYFVLGFSLFAQGQFKPALSEQWGTDVKGVTAAIGWMMVGRLVAYPFAGPIADRVSRRLGAVIGALLLVASFAGIIMVGSPTLGTIMCVVAGLGNGFLDPAVYPALSEIFPKRAHIANLFLKFAILVAQFLLPLIMSATGDGTAAATGGYRAIYIGFGVLAVLTVVGMAFAPFPPNESKAAAQQGGSAFSFNATLVMLMVLGITTLTTFTLWGNTNQELGKAYGMENPAITQSYYAVGAMLAILASTALLTRVRATQIIIVYPIISTAALLAVVFIQQDWIVPWVGFVIGWTGAGGILQLVTSTGNSLFPRSRGLVTSLIMISSAVGVFLIMQVASNWVTSNPTNVLLLNAAVTAFGAVLAVFVDRAEKARLANTE